MSVEKKNILDLLLEIRKREGLEVDANLVAQYYERLEINLFNSDAQTFKELRDLIGADVTDELGLDDGAHE